MNMKKSAASLISVMLGAIAFTFVSVASGWLVHNPKVPAELRKVNS